MDEGGSRSGASLSEGALVRGTGRWVSFTGDPGGYVEKALETGISLHWGPAGELGRGLINQGL
jgi:hypothetical protein